MINIFLIFYWLVILFYVGGCLAVIYHIWTYRFDTKIASMAIFIFLTGVTILLTANLALALQIPWQELSIIL